jgi:hypothetical protein
MSILISSAKPGFGVLYGLGCGFDFDGGPLLDSDTSDRRLRGNDDRNCGNDSKYVRDDLAFEGGSGWLL